MDEFFLRLINQFAGNSVLLDDAVREISRNMLLKGTVAAIVLNILWFQNGEHRRRRRNGVIAALIVACVAIVAGRVLAQVLPFSMRPIHTPGAPLHMPLGMLRTAFSGMSSLPSDHAVMFFALAASVLQISRMAGSILLAHAIIVICLPRIYLGLHWPSDIVAGALIGSGIAFALQGPLVRVVAGRAMVDASLARPFVFYPVFFLVNYQIATMFSAMRAIGEDGWKGLMAFAALIN